MLNAINFRNSYFGIINPLEIIDRWFNRYSHSARVRLNKKDLLVEWTDRAQRQFDQKSAPLTVEMQLYFSCVVKKRVLFHERVDFDIVAVNQHFNLAFRVIESAVCSPEEFASSYPEARELNASLDKMTPNRLSIDFRSGLWQGEFGY